jgi:hypothetical protein
MTIGERMQRAEALLSWARGFVARQILSGRPPLSIVSPSAASEPR